MDRYFRCISGATNVSAFELSQLKLPDPRLLKQYRAVALVWKPQSDEPSALRTSSW
jgi:hypothetical protein